MTVILTILGLAAIVAAMVLLYFKVLPQRLDGTFTNRYLQMIHDYFNFKKLYIESVLKFLFTLATVICVVLGSVGLLQALVDLVGGLIDMVRYFGLEYFPYLLGDFMLSILGSVLLAVLGPVVLRLVYEGTMMLILMVKNVIEINGKIKAPEEGPAAEADDVTEE